jgi:hypothetical protein
VKRHACGWALVLATGAFGATPAAGPPPEAAPPPIPVVLRTKDTVHVGRDLRFSDGVFRLREDTGEASFAQGEVAQVTLVRQVALGAFGHEMEEEPPGEPARAGRDPVLRLALGVLVAYRLESVGWWPHKAERWRRGQPRGVFYLPAEKPPEVFPRLARRVTDPELVALLCEETALLCLRHGAPQAPAELFAKAEEAAKGKQNGLAFVYGLMHAAVLMEPGPLMENARVVKGLRDSYPEQVPRVQKFMELIREKMRPLRPGPPRGPRPGGPLPEGGRPGPEPPPPTKP